MLESGRRTLEATVQERTDSFASQKLFIQYFRMRYGPTAHSQSYLSRKPWSVRWRSRWPAQGRRSLQTEAISKSPHLGTATSWANKVNKNYLQGVPRNRPARCTHSHESGKGASLGGCINLCEKKQRAAPTSESRLGSSFEINWPTKSICHKSHEKAVGS